MVVLGALAVMVFAALASTRVLVVGGLIGVALFLGVSTKMVVGSQRSQSVAARIATGTSDVNWVDDRVPEGEAAALLFNSDFAADGHPAWQTEFWNRDVQRVVYLGARDFGFPGFEALVSPTGLLSSATGAAARPPAVDYIVAPVGVDLAGEHVATEGRFALWRISKPLRLATQREGFTGDGWTGADATFTRYRQRSSWSSTSRARSCQSPPASSAWSSSLGGRWSKCGGGSLAATAPARSGSGLRLRRFRFRSTWLRPSRRLTWGSRTHASSECSRA